MQSHESANNLSQSGNKLGALDKYKFKPFLGSSHHWAIAEALKCPKEAVVLDIGCGSSAIGYALKEAGFTNLFAVEIDEEARKNALPIYQEVKHSIEDFQGKTFDLVLLLDVIEHLPNPEEFLKSVAKMLNPGGVLLLSVPNVAHWSVRIPLLFGFFNYTDRAILDKTHLQFFTRRRLTKILHDVGSLKITHLGATIEPAEFVLPKIIWNNPIFRFCSQIRLTIAHLLPGLMAYQHVAILRKI